MSDGNRSRTGGRNDQPTRHQHRRWTGSDAEARRAEGGSVMKITKGRALMHRRRRLGVQAQELAQMLGWPPSSVSKMENGRCESSDARFALAYEALYRIEQEMSTQ